jgi:hypothetical protein
MKLLAAARIVVALAVLVAVGAQFHASAGRPHFAPVNFFSFFTNVSNIVGAFVLLAAALGRPADAHRRDVLRGAATLCLAIVGIVFAGLLANEASAVLPWVNAIVHQVMPVAIVADWFIDPPRARLTRGDGAWWFALPAAYIAYTLVRGGIVHWYPYPFLNVDVIGAPAVAAYVAGIAVLGLLIAWALLARTGRSDHDRSEDNGRAPERV